MADKTPEQEPSIEEILASIRQIISDDDEKDIDSVEESAVDSQAERLPSSQKEPVREAEPEKAAPEPQAEAKPAPKAAPPAPKAEPAFVAAKPEPKPAPAPVRDDVLELTPEMAEAGGIEVDLQESKPAPAPPVAERAEPVPASEILTSEARSATVASMAKLAGNMPITRHREHGNITLEDLVREMLNPMLKDWLSDNLPPMVERMVQKELEKLARQAQDV